MLPDQLLSLLDVDPLQHEPEGVKRSLAAWWMRRREAELEVARAFERIAATIKAQGLPDALHQVALSAIDEERAHASIAETLAQRLDPAVASASPPVSSGLEALPRDLHPIVQVIVTTCVQEPVAIAFLTHCLTTTTSPVIRKVYEHLLHDEETHTRLGADYVAQLPREVRVAVREHRESIVAACARVWVERIEQMPNINRPDLGVPPRHELSEVVANAFRDKVRPLFP